MGILSFNDKKRKEYSFIRGRKKETFKLWVAGPRSHIENLITFLFLNLIIYIYIYIRILYKYIFKFLNYFR